jgi:mono/diheme cytochrome c family protein
MQERCLPQEGELKKIVFIGVAALAVLAAGVLLSGRDGAAQAYIDPSDQALVARGNTVYAGQCAACHGANLEGQPNWRERMSNGRLPAPPHDVNGHTWHHPDAVLVDIVRHGLVPGKTAPDGYQSDMPAYGQVLSDTEVVAVLAYIKSRWPKEALEAQKEVSLQHPRRAGG